MRSRPFPVMVGVMAWTVACHSSPPPVEPSLQLGLVHQAIQTTSPQAQREFDRGVAALYGFNYDEARHRFAIAMRTDSTCAMCSWGFAMANGPTLNTRNQQLPGAREAAERAERLAKDPYERALASALVARLTPSHSERSMPLDPDQRLALNAGFATAMRRIAEQHRDDDFVQVLFAEALLVATSQWDSMWKRDGSPTTPNVTEAMMTLERVLARNPNHIGAIHFYIHATDDSPFVARVAPYAERLGRLAPDSGHLVHMPSHTFLRLGRYAEAEDVNRAAIDADKRYLARTPPGTDYEMFAMHPYQYLWYVTLWAGKRADAKQLAEHVGHAFGHMPGPMAARAAMYMPVTCARFGLWDEALRLPEVKGGIGAIATHFARGLAFVAKQRLDDAAREVDAIRAVAAPRADEPAPPPGMGPPPALLAIMRAIDSANAASAAGQLEGAIALARGDHARAITALEQAVAAEDERPLEGEMSEFPLPARQRLGAALLIAGRPRDAERVYREDLARQPDNGWSLFGLATALDAQHSTDAKPAWERYRASWKRSDIQLTNSVF